MLNPKIIFLGKTSNTNEIDYHLRIGSQSLFRVRLIPIYRGGSHRPKPFLCFCHKKGPEEADASKGEFMGLVRGSYPQEKGVTHRQISFTVYSVEWLPDGYRRATVMGRTQRPGGGPIERGTGLTCCAYVKKMRVTVIMLNGCLKVDQVGPFTTFIYAIFTRALCNAL